MQSNVAIIIPAGPGDTAWRKLLPQLDAAEAREIVLVLAEGDDEFVDTNAETRVVHSPAGRARQLNSGANASHADWLWFLHADSEVSTKTLDATREFVCSGQDAIGYFRLGFADDGPRWMFLNTWGAALRSRLFGLPFGDQGLLMPRRVFEGLGGFDESVGKGEDHALIWAARAQGVPLRAIKAMIRTSARRYAENGWWRTTRMHLGMTREQATRFSRHAKATETRLRS